MAGLGFLSRSLVAAPLEPRTFEQFGEVLDPDRVVPEPINDGTTRRHSDLAQLDVAARGDPVLSVYVASAREFPLRIARLERHREASQVFLPLGTHRFIVVVAPGLDAPEWNNLRAFITAPGQGVALRRATWHHGLVALGDGDRFAVIEGANYREDTVEVPATDEITLLRPV